MLFFSPISIQQRVNFTKSLAIMLRSGIVINEALTALAAESDSHVFGKIIYRVRDDIENGTILSAAFEKEAKTFGTIFISLIKAGEESGTLQNNLQFLADWLSRNSDLRREVSAAMLYPKLVFGAAIVLGGSLAIFILPKLVPLFDQLHVELPFITRLLLAISLFVQQYWFVCIVVFFGSCIGLVYINRIYAVRKVFHHIYIHMPFLGSLLKNYQLALVTQLFGTLLKSGIPLSGVMDIVADATTNIHYLEALHSVKNNIEKGETLSRAMGTYPELFPKIAINIIAVGEKSGTLVSSFDYLAEYYTKEVSAQAKKLPTIVEPLLLVFIAIVVGFIALAIIMPIYALTGNIIK